MKLAAFRGVALFLALVVCGQTEAYVSGVTVTPTAQSVPVGTSPSIAATWSVRTNTNFATGTPTCGPVAYSTVGEFIIPARNDILIGQVNTLVSMRSSCFGGWNSAPESVLVPADVIYRAQKSGATAFAYRRTFTDEYGIGSAQITLNITSSAASGFSLTTMSLTFDNGSPVRVLERKEKNRAVANLGFNGTGLLQGTWEVADPSSTSGEPVYRPLGLVRQYLNGVSPQTIQSPDLPTDRTGLYLVRLRVTDPAPGFDLPVIRYFVADERAGVLAPAVPVNVLTPPNPSMLASDTVFAWEEIKGARAYQIEIYAKPRTAGDDLPDLGGAPAANPLLPTTPPVAGMLVHGKLTRATLSAQTRSHLLPGRSYLWRVTALRADGSIAGESAVREMRVP